MANFMRQRESPRRRWQPSAEKDEVFTGFQVAPYAGMESGVELRHVQTKQAGERINWSRQIAPPRRAISEPCKN